MSHENYIVKFSKNFIGMNEKIFKIMKTDLIFYALIL